MDLLEARIVYVSPNGDWAQVKPNEDEYCETHKSRCQVFIHVYDYCTLATMPNRIENGEATGYQTWMIPQMIISERSFSRDFMPNLHPGMVVMLDRRSLRMSNNTKTHSHKNKLKATAWSLRSVNLPLFAYQELKNLGRFFICIAGEESSMLVSKVLGDPDGFEVIDFELRRKLRQAQQNQDAWLEYRSFLGNARVILTPNIRNARRLARAPQTPRSVPFVFFHAFN